MSRAFVSEDAAAASAALLPERPVSAGPNPVTQRGLELIDAQIDRLQNRHDETQSDDPERPAIDRDLRYWRARRLSAQLVPALIDTPEEVVFGCRVTLHRDGQSATSYRIVGEDEADPAKGKLSWSSPLASALLGARAGDRIELGGGRPPVEVVGLGRS
jgi:transcription elongation GreA/GreB family factor